jgi:lipoate-protein ligase A
MLFVDNLGLTDPRLNLALEEYLLRRVQREEPLLLFYINEPAVIIGRNQNTLAEIDPDYVGANGIHVVRRLSGGGAVYHDMGNLNFSFVTPGQENLHDFGRFTRPVIEVLRGLGVEAELRGRSDIFAGGKKVSGNAQYASGGRMFSHGTLLFNTDLEAMLRAINPRRVTIESKAVQSVRNYVVNLSELLPQGMTLAALKEAILRGVFGDGEIPALEMDEIDWTQMQMIADERYRAWDWNYGRSPRFNVHKSGRFASGRIEAHIDVDEGRIREVRFEGDFAGTLAAEELAERLKGLRYEPAALQAALAQEEVAAYFGDKTSTAEVVELLY